MMWVPKVVYAGTTLVLSLPQRLWTPGSVAVGGTDVSAAGIPESFRIRRDQTLDVRLAVRESEWPAVHTWIGWMQDTAGTCRFYPDRNGTRYHTVYLESPKLGEEVRPERGEFAGTYEIGLRLRDSAGVAFDVRAYE